MAILFDCSGCGRRLKVSEVYRGKRTKCPECAAISVVPEHDELPVLDAVAAQEAPSAGGPAQVRQAEGIGVAETGPTCPNCRKILARGAVLCVDCGYDFRSGRRLETAHERFEQRWDTGMPLPLRLGLLIALQCACLFVAALIGDALWGLALVFAGSVFLVLLLGTWLKLHVVRTTKGKVLLTRTWCVCFIPAIRHQVNVRHYDRILIDATATGWLSVVLLLDLLWGLRASWGGFSQASGPSRFHVYLKSDRRGEEFSLFHSADDGKMRQIVEALEELTGLRIDRR